MENNTYEGLVRRLQETAELVDKGGKTIDIVNASINLYSSIMKSASHLTHEEIQSLGSMSVMLDFLYTRTSDKYIYKKYAGEQ